LQIVEMPVEIKIPKDHEFQERTEADEAFFHLISEIDCNGVEVVTRNALCKRIPFFYYEFTSLPLVTLVPVAVKKALLEMAWFLNPQPTTCPEVLRDWWAGQLDSDGFYVCGYGDQLRRFSTPLGSYDQVEEIIEQLKNHPYSRRNLLTTWNPAEMSSIAEVNDNPKTPATCHLTMVQFFVDPDGSLTVTDYQRSGDVLAGVKHNWVQHWAFFTWLAHRAGLTLKKMIWIGGDLHIYQEESHLRVAQAVMDEYPEFITTIRPKLAYTPTSEDFNPNDFSVHWPCEKPEPVTKERVKLL
jgi:thymidylate synthase